MMSLCGAYYEDLLDPRTDLTVICCCPVKGCGQEVAKHTKKPVAPVGQSARHVDIGQGQPGGIRKLVLSAILCNGDESREISIRLYVDGGCGAAELVLQPEDIASLNLAAEGLPMADTQSKVTLQRYEQVTVKFETQIGETWRAILTPVCIVPVETAADDVHGVTGEEDTSRLLGYCGLHRMGLKQDFAHHRLIKVLRRI